MSKSQSKSPKTVTILFPINSIEAGGEQYKPVKIDIRPSFLWTPVELPASEVISISKDKKGLPTHVVLTHAGIVRVGEALRWATLDTAKIVEEEREEKSLFHRDTKKG